MLEAGAEVYYPCRKVRTLVQQPVYQRVPQVKSHHWYLLSVKQACRCLRQEGTDTEGDYANSVHYVLIIYNK